MPTRNVNLTDERDGFVLERKVGVTKTPALNLPMAQR